MFWGWGQVDTSMPAGVDDNLARITKEHPPHPKQHSGPQEADPPALESLDGNDGILAFPYTIWGSISIISEGGSVA